ncbi:hypothetical protein TNCV_178291 [Trichonephila clavipes]|nr:hypothetical protein TNCV_178291 [Trichonephila clavipes]
MESVDYEGNLEISAQEEAIEEEEKIHRSKEDEEEFQIKSPSTSGRMLDKISDGVISKKFSKKDLQQLTMKISEEQKKEEELKKEKQEEDLKGKRGKKAQRKAQAKKEEDEKKKEEEKMKKDQKEGEEKEEKEGVEKHGEEESELPVNLPVESKMFAKSQQKVMKRSRGDSNFSQQITDLSFRQRKVLIITRNHLLYPQSHKHQELKELLEMPEVHGLPELERLGSQINQTSTIPKKMKVIENPAHHEQQKMNVSDEIILIFIAVICFPTQKFLTKTSTRSSSSCARTYLGNSESSDNTVNLLVLRLNWMHNGLQSTANDCTVNLKTWSSPCLRQKYRLLRTFQQS